MSDQIHDVIMVGAGPSSLAAAIYTTREDIETLLAALVEEVVILGSRRWADAFFDIFFLCLEAKERALHLLEYR